MRILECRVWHKKARKCSPGARAVKPPNALFSGLPCPYVGRGGLVRPRPPAFSSCGSVPLFSSALAREWGGGFTVLPRALDLVPLALTLGCAKYRSPHSRAFAPCFVPNDSQDIPLPSPRGAQVPRLFSWFHLNRSKKKSTPFGVLSHSYRAVQDPRRYSREVDME